MSADAINTQSMNQLFHQLGIDVSWEQFVRRYQKICHTAAMIQGLNEVGIHKFADSFQFEKSYMEKCKKELQEYIETFPVSPCNNNANFNHISSRSRLKRVPI